MMMTGLASTNSSYAYWHLRWAAGTTSHEFGISNEFLVTILIYPGIATFISTASRRVASSTVTFDVEPRRNTMSTNHIVGTVADAVADNAVRRATATSHVNDGIVP
jgi:hypothetical protein